MPFTRQFALLVTVVLGFATSAVAASKKPNVLFLFADDMRADSIHALGNAEIKTPQLDALVERGMAFRHAYCLGGNMPAVCLPSRNMLLSGQAYFRWANQTTPGGRQGMYAPADGPNFARTMRDAGYATYHHGKRGNTAPPIQATFEVNKYLVDDEAERRSGHPGKEIVDAAVTYLDTRNDPRPFFMYLAFGNPHDPRVAAPEYLAQYDAAKLTLPKNYQPQHPFDDGEMTVRDEQLLPWPRTEAAVRETLREYYATITALDAQIGRLLAHLKQRGELENTLVVFSADQGIAVGSHGLLGKQNLYEAGMGVPLFFAGPGVAHGGNDALVYLLDIFPTVCGLVGASAPANIDGRSFADAVQGKASAARKELFFSYRHLMRAVRDERWKLIYYASVPTIQLFDLQADPDETRNLAALPEHWGTVSRLLVKLQENQAVYGDDLKLDIENVNKSPPAWTPPTAEELRKAAPKPAGKKRPAA
ncbi:MAG: sulfatase-like hydrolase/transferase [Planctomycetes bacterium]|nr:sulfatase-like hydrolase/transferase [Planctomycetota bacterium]